MRVASSCAVSALVLGLVACNQSAQTPAGPGPSAAQHLPAGAGCSETVNRFRALIDSDLSAGHTTKSVHAQVSQEIGAAAQLCASGNDAGARAAIAASRSRHGYPS